MSRAPGQAAPGTPRQSPIERFLGHDEAAGGPFALLSVSPATCTDENVLAALDRQLDRVAHHIECDTPEADEVRLALHAAAAQLLDPAVRRHLRKRWLNQTAPPHVVPTAAQHGAPALRRSTSELLLEHDVVLALGMLGGWNSRSLHRLVALAHARGFTSQQVAAALSTLAKRRGARDTPNGSPAQPAPAPIGRAPANRPSIRASQPLPEQIDPAQVLLRNALIFGGIGILLLALLIALIVGMMTREPGSAGRSVPAPPPTTGGTQGGSAPQPTDEGSGVPNPGPAARATDPRPAPASREPGDLAAALRELAACPDALGVDPVAAVERFENAIGVLASEWCRAPRDRLVAAHDAIVEFLYRAGADPAVSGRAVDAIGAGAEALAPGAPDRPLDDPARVWPAAWSLGMLVRLNREQDLTAATREAIESRIGLAIGLSRPAIERSFESGATVALQAAPGAMLGGAASPPVEAWQRWAEAADALAGPDRGSHDAIILSGLDALLVLGPEPSAERAVLEAIGDLVPRVSWRSGDEARRRVLRWFDDRRITPADLQAVTSALVTKSGAQGVDLTMVLSPAASERVRADLRERYARVWGIAEAVDRGAIALQWADAARAALERSHAAPSPVEHLAAATVLARVNESAWRLWKGDNAEAARILGDLTSDIDTIAAPGAPGAPEGEGAGTDGGWAEGYLALRRNIPLRLEMLTRLARRTGSIGPVDAEVLATEALAGSPAEVRTRAADLVRGFAGSPAMVNALLEALPRAPRVIQNAALLGYVGQRQLPPVRDPAYPAEARRALVETLLVLTAAQGDLSAIDQLSHLLAASYRGQSSETILTAAQRAEADPPAAHISAAAVRDRWHAAATKAGPGLRSAAVQGSQAASSRGWGSHDLAEIGRRHAGLAGLARGLVQAFAAEQVGACELMALVVAVEQPAQIDRVREAMAGLAQSRRSARHILEQINAAERAAVQLWLARAPETPA